MRPRSNYGITYHRLELKKTLRFATRYICVLRSIFTAQTAYFSANNLTIILDRNCRLSYGGRNWSLKTAFEVWNHFVILFSLLRIILPCVIFPLYHLNEILMYFLSSPYFQLIYIHFITTILREDCSAAWNSLRPFLTCISLPLNLLFLLFSKTFNSRLLS